MDDIVTEFLVESLEGLDQLDNDFVALEQNPGDKDLIANIFRCIHTIKGTCGFLAFSKLEAVTHVGESLLSHLRDGDLQITPEIISALLTLVDAVREIMACIEADGNEGSKDYPELIAELERLGAGVGAPEEAPPEPEPEPEPVVEAAADEAPLPQAMIDFKPVKAKRRTKPEEVAASAPEPTPPAAPAPAPAPKAAPKPEPTKRASQKESSGAVADASIRVDVGLLDNLMTLVGELVLARNQVLQHTTQNSDAALNATAQRLNHITSELQDSVMKTRMQPIGNVWSKFPRIIRDLAATCGKKIKLELEGQETELDKTILEAIKDPLTHIIRNAADHGIESPEERVSAGKPAEGTVVCRAYHEGGQVNIEISDDGGGIDPQRVLRKALDKGLIGPEEAVRLGTREILSLIFLPGFSTAEKVTNISGRGVGMDVVRSNIERIGGAVDINSSYGQGSALKIKIPLTLAIIPALTVTCREQRYALPQVSLLELVRLEGETAVRGIERIQGVPVHRLRGNLLPLIYLDEVLDHPPVERPESDDEPIVNIVVLQADGQSFGLVVDEINDTEEIVVKPLASLLNDIVTFSGATIMGDGSVALILDVLGIAQVAGLHERGDRQARELESENDASSGRQETLLLFTAGEDHRVAIPLSTVSRLEELPASRIESSGRTSVLQYRGRILPLVYLADALGLQRPSRDDDVVEVIVYRHNGAQVGLVVQEILDIVDDDLVIHRFESSGAVVGSVVIDERVTDVVDVAAAVTASNVPLYRHDGQEAPA
ncbi:MAG: chemotaxis protein CheA [Deltaproteobacteria bacterium]